MDLPAKLLIGPAVLPSGPGRDRFMDVGQPAGIQPQLASPKAFAGPTALQLAHVNRAVAQAAGIVAVMTECWPWLAAEDLPAPPSALFIAQAAAVSR